MLVSLHAESERKLDADPISSRIARHGTASREARAAHIPPMSDVRTPADFSELELFCCEFLRHEHLGEYDAAGAVAELPHSHSSRTRSREAPRAIAVSARSCGPAWVVRSRDPRPAAASFAPLVSAGGRRATRRLAAPTSLCARRWRTPSRPPGSRAGERAGLVRLSILRTRGRRRARTSAGAAAALTHPELCSKAGLESCTYDYTNHMRAPSTGSHETPSRRVWRPGIPFLTQALDRDNWVLSLLVAFWIVAVVTRGQRLRRLRVHVSARPAACVGNGRLTLHGCFRRCLRQSRRNYSEVSRSGGICWSASNSHGSSANGRCRDIWMDMPVG
jgi:hypothetical protein